ncbi:hypothetical protein BLOT_010689 [Blomia tropicalis]|nr:hypothetical protein BLOT_010689 [Blomia tropicalis]
MATATMTLIQLLFLYRFQLDFFRLRKDILPIMELNHQKCSQGYINERVHHKTLPICYKSNKLHNIRTIRKTVKAQKMINVILFACKTT